MSSRWKRRKARCEASERGAAAWGEAEEQLTVTTAAGRFTGRPAGERGWMRLTGMRLAPAVAGVPVEQVVASASCPETGEVFVKPLTGRYRKLPEAELRRRRDELEGFLKRLGPFERLFQSGPLWMQVEHLEDIIEFEMEPPCGCGQPGGAAC